MNEDNIAKTIGDILNGDAQSAITKLALSAAALIGWIIFKRWAKGQNIQDAKNESEIKHAADQVANKISTQVIQAQLNSTQTIIAKVKATTVDILKVPKHDNSGDCKRCNLIFDTYPSFYPPLRSWFKGFQSLHPEFHISGAGRGKKAQEKAVVDKLSRAHWTQSAHNYNAAIDTFVLLPGSKDIYPVEWYNKVLVPELEKRPDLNWYGDSRRTQSFYELPHIQVTSWLDLTKQGVLKLVE